MSMAKRQLLKKYLRKSKNWIWFDFSSSLEDLLLNTDRNQDNLRNMIRCAPKEHIDILYMIKRIIATASSFAQAKDWHGLADMAIFDLTPSVQRCLASQDANEAIASIDREIEKLEARGKKKNPYYDQLHPEEIPDIYEPSVMTSAHP